MLYRKYNRLYALNVCVWSLILVSGIACTAPLHTDQSMPSNRLYAENSDMKRRLPLVERENDILKTENFQHRKKIKELEDNIKKLVSDLEALTERYNKDMAAEQDRILSLQETMEALEMENTEKIQALNLINKGLEEKMTRKVKALNGQMLKQKESFSHEREQLINENSQRESALSGQLDDVKKTLKTRELEISSLKIAISEISSKLGDATALADRLKKARDESEEELKAVKAINIGLAKKVNALYDELAAKEGPAKAKQ